MSLISDLIAENVGAVVRDNADAIESELKSSDTGKLTISLPVKLTLVNNRVYLTAGLTYSRKFSDEVEASVELADPMQPELPAQAVTEDDARKLIAEVMKTEGVSYQKAKIIAIGRVAEIRAGKQAAAQE
jgi:hypothetical protein